MNKTTSCAPSHLIEHNGFLSTSTIRTNFHLFIEFHAKSLLYHTEPSMQKTFICPFSCIIDELLLQSIVNRCEFTHVCSQQYNRIKLNKYLWCFCTERNTHCLRCCSVRTRHSVGRWSQSMFIIWHIVFLLANINSVFYWIYVVTTGDGA